MTGLLLGFIFSPNIVLIILAIFLWGIVMGAHETIMKAGIADITPKSKRGTGYGIFNVIYGIALFIGSVLAGFLYEISFTFIIWVNLIFEGLALILYCILRKEINQSK